MTCPMAHSRRSPRSPSSARWPSRCSPMERPPYWGIFTSGLENFTAVSERCDMDFDVIVIGSGFGGAITSCRLAEKGRKVLVLERGKKWDRTTYPRELEDEWIWSHVDPEQ